MADESDRMDDPADWVEEPDYAGPLPIADDRHQHPYVSHHPAPDLSAKGWENDRGETHTAEGQAWISRMAFHEVEGFLRHLTPRATLELTASLLYRLRPMASATSDEPGVPTFEEIAGEPLTDPRRQLDPSGAFLAFEELFGEQLGEAFELIAAIAERCPGCGRKHGEIGWVHSLTGESVRVERMTDRHVYFRRQLAPAEGDNEPQWSEVDEWSRIRFEHTYVPGESVALLGSRDSERPR